VGEGGNFLFALFFGGKAAKKQPEISNSPFPFQGVLREG
jgi:hypothetical protein